jgi:RNA methyltransferase, TrmH family
MSKPQRPSSSRSPSRPGASRQPAPSRAPSEVRGHAKKAPVAQRPPEREVELVYGFRAGLAVLEKRPGDITRIGIARERLNDASARIASSTNHEGLVLETTPRKWSSLPDVADALVRTRGFGIALDRVRNPYNVGAILRSAAFFGIEAAILGAIAPHPAIAPDAIRVAEGGVEHLRLARTTDLAESLSRLRGRGLRVVGAESDGIHDLFEYAFQAPTILVLGHEREGLSPRVRSVCDALVKIPGSGAIESLNVGIAASLFIAELSRTKRAPAKVR